MLSTVVCVVVSLTIMLTCFTLPATAKETEESHAKIEEALKKAATDFPKNVQFTFVSVFAIIMFVR